MKDDRDILHSIMNRRYSLNEAEDDNTPNVYTYNGSSEDYKQEYGLLTIEELDELVSHITNNKDETEK